MHFVAIVLRFTTFILLMLLISCSQTNDHSKQEDSVQEEKKYEESPDVLEKMHPESDTLLEILASSSEGTMHKGDENPDVKIDVSQEKKRPAKLSQPEIRFDQMSFDFDEIIEGEVVDVKFAFENVGNAPLLIKSAAATCGCTIPSYPFIPIEPGEEGYIGVTFNSVGKRGYQKPSIAITTNAQPPTYVLKIVGNVLAKEN